MWQLVTGDFSFIVQLYSFTFINISNIFSTFKRFVDKKNIPNVECFNKFSTYLHKNVVEIAYQQEKKKTQI